ncbi:MAG: hypothetical protein KKF46_07835 [Nanoarchaeota archaeon]|nr:hypothetical protein [Nanoarchaeota archaeon]MBU1322238.1 hypothetical protein [Nanoarchaeota archaeon]MBU1598047.1 hypothetical protein [Nanoarchaeota archaeon]MBU2442052.1 hypothetical protein [Nanoarchaeota archaeon]
MKITQRVKKIMATGMLLTTLATVTPVIASTKKEAPKVKKGSFAIAPTFSLKEDYGAVRLSGGGEVSGVDVGGFLDVYGTKERPFDFQTHFGKITASKSIAKGIDAAESTRQ